MLYDSDNEIDDATVQVKKTSKTTAGTDLLPHLKAEIMSPVNSDLLEDEEEPFRYGRGYKAICLSPRAGQKSVASVAVNKKASPPVAMEICSTR